MRVRVIPFGVGVFEMATKGKENILEELEIR